jgi:hypothetical protein
MHHLGSKSTLSIVCTAFMSTSEKDSTSFLRVFLLERGLRSTVCKLSLHGGCLSIFSQIGGMCKFLYASALTDMVDW